MKNSNNSSPQQNPKKKTEISTNTTSLSIASILDLEKIWESKHFIFLSKGAEFNDIEAEKADRHLDIVCARLGFNLPSKKIKFIYLTEDNAMWVERGFSMSKDNMIVSAAFFNPIEITQFLVEMNIWTSHAVLQNWLSVLNWQWTLEWSCTYEWKDLDDWMRSFQEIDLLPNLNDIFDKHKWYSSDRISPISAFLVRNILENHWTEFFKRFYSRINANSQFHRIEAIYEEMTNQKLKDIYQ
ncbi:MAG: hypothetical protein ACD_2C00193G0007 [uncultured bacterium (gcode 4)]|uniref:Uncharacterized protein n=1 Tax=uncultured bacterium (gcode 4) TaxID=1234023 RepID=K2FDT3_9BACT|nr:MAG: hypothetical protein ACD_2C00193G0007 [uncultured bacterium (gcode 4)]